MKILIILLFIVYSSNSENEPFHECDPFPAPLPTAPIIPELPDRFSTRIEVNQNGKVASDLYINFDYVKSRAAISIVNNNTETKLIFDYFTDEIHEIVQWANYSKGPLVPGDPYYFASPRVCKSVPLSTSSNINYYFGCNQGPDHLIPNEPLDVLHLNFPKTFNVSRFERGIPCDCFLSCVYRPETKQNFTLEFCFSTAEYFLPESTPKFTRLPVRAYFDGVTQLSNGTYQNFTEIHDFYEFRPDHVHEEFFQTPPDIFCENRKKTQKIPGTPSHFRFSQEESVNGVTNHIHDLIYDSDRNMVRVEQRPFKQQGPFFVSDPLITINDYNIGVSFNLNRNLKNCSIVSIADDSFDADTNFTISLFNETNNYVVQLKRPDSILSLDSDYIFTGKRRINNIPVDNYVSNRSYLIQSGTIIAEYTFASDFGFETSSGISSDVPTTFIQREISEVDMETTNSYLYRTYYNFDKGEQPFQVFDTSECFAKKDNIDIRFKFPYTGLATAQDLAQDEEFISLEMYYLLIGAVNETWTRFSRPKISISEDGNLYVRLAILPSPPSLAFFTLVPGKWLLTAALEVKNNITSIQSCASFCLADIRCLSFDYSVSVKNCFLNPKHGSQAGSSSNKGYNHYSRNTLNGFYSRPSYALWSVLFNMTMQSKIALNLPVGSGQKVTLIATDIDQIVDNDNRYGTTAALNKYNRKKPSKKFTSNKNIYLLNQNIDECAHACTDQLKFECLSFDFCYISGDCRLSEKLTSNDPNDYIDSEECDVYEKDSLFHYTEFPAKATINLNDKNIKVESPGECARKCDQETSIHCRSFNFCPSNNKCYLSNNHIVDGSQSENSDLICTHYSRNYLSDFVNAFSATVELVGDLVYENSNAESCSSLCVTADGFNCQSFNFCPGSKKCLLYNTKLGINPGQVEQTDLCYHYIREYFYVTSSNVNNNQSNDDSSTAILTVLSIIFSIFGLLTGALFAYLYIKKR